MLWLGLPDTNTLAYLPTLFNFQLPEANALAYCCGSVTEEEEKSFITSTTERNHLKANVYLLRVRQSDSSCSSRSKFPPLRRKLRL
jgi:hypothetical protein